MAAERIDGKTIAREYRARVAEGVAKFKQEAGRPPGLFVVLVGDDPASAVYVGKKEKAAAEVGMHSGIVRLPGDASREDVLTRLEEIGSDPAIDGILVQLPLPSHLDTDEIQRAVPALKDVDGFHPQNAGRLLLGQEGGFVACTPAGVMVMLEHCGIDLRGLEAVIVGRSNIVGKPLAQLMLAKHATVTICHSRTRDLAGVCRRADVLVACTGVPGLIRGEHIKPGAVVIDVGINPISDPEQARDLLAGQPRRLERFEKRKSALVGDVHFGEALEKASFITPVPGGVGPMTVALLLGNALEAAWRAHRRPRN